ncbi:regulatory iron-sulfur-containing complex subunit RicT [soil metagenome]
MGCSSCSTTSTGTPGGCQSNGTCGTSGCNKLNVYNWLSDMVLPEGHKPFDIVEVRFKGSRKEFFRNVNSLEVQVGEMVAVEGNPGHDIGEVSLVGELVRFQLRKHNVKEDAADIKLLYRTARPADVEKFNEVKELEFNTMHRSRTIAMQLGLKMKLSDVEFQGDGKKATFFYTADERVDFRELIKKLAEEFKVRVEMRQIGMRQEAARLGGIGSCGRELCCSTWLTDFKIVSTSAARYQNLSLNPLKLAGQCGKLKCCLNYELDTYLDAIRDIPESNIRLYTAKGSMMHRKTDIFKRIMWYSVLPEVKEGEERPFMGADQWVPMAVDRVKEIIELNKQDIKPAEFGSIEIEEIEDDTDYKDVVGQDSLTRMDRVKKKKKKKKSSDAPKSAAPAASSTTTPPPRTNRSPQQRPDQNSNKQEQKPQQNNRPQQQTPRPNQQGPRPAPQPNKENAPVAGTQPVKTASPQQEKPASPQQPRQDAPKNTPPRIQPPQQSQGNPADKPSGPRVERKIPDAPKPQASNPAPAPDTKPAAPVPPSTTPSAPTTPSNRPPRISPRQEGGNNDNS